MRRQTKNKILKTITTTAIITLILSACCLDGENIVLPVALIGASLAWIALFAAANGER
jgi:hypothetical protein